MKQLLFIIITFMFVSNVYAQSPAEILGKGKVVSSQFSDMRRGWYHHIIVVYKNAVYNCKVDTADNEVWCTQVEQE